MDTIETARHHGRAGSAVSRHYCGSGLRCKIAQFNAVA
jgi:hypothetical protein